MNKKDLEEILEFIKEHKDEIREILGVEKVYIPQPYPVPTPYPYHPYPSYPTDPYQPVVISQEGIGEDFSFMSSKVM